MLGTITLTGKNSFLHFTSNRLKGFAKVQIKFFGRVIFKVQGFSDKLPFLRILRGCFSRRCGAVMNECSSKHCCPEGVVSKHCGFSRHGWLTSMSDSHTVATASFIVWTIKYSEFFCNISNGPECLCEVFQHSHSFTIECMPRVLAKPLLYINFFSDNIFIPERFAMLKLSLAKPSHSSARLLLLPNLLVKNHSCRQKCTWNHSWQHVFQSLVLPHVSTCCQPPVSRHVKCFIRLDWDPNSGWISVSLVTQWWGGAHCMGLITCQNQFPFLN